MVNGKTPWLSIDYVAGVKKIDMSSVFLTPDVRRCARKGRVSWRYDGDGNGPGRSALKTYLATGVRQQDNVVVMVRWGEQSAAGGGRLITPEDVDAQVVIDAI